ncbi:MAG TPA: hypothetical protein VIY27_11215 [Myxococcota bacterium]
MSERPRVCAVEAITLAELICQLDDERFPLPADIDTELDAYRRARDETSSSDAAPSRVVEPMEPLDRLRVLIFEAKQPVFSGQTAAGMVDDPELERELLNARRALEAADRRVTQLKVAEEEVGRH